MKTKKTGNKLSVSKTTIANLEHYELNQAKGGTNSWDTVCIAICDTRHLRCTVIDTVCLTNC